VIDHKLLHDAILMKINVLNAQHFIAESWCCVTHAAVVNCFQKCGFSLNQTRDCEEAAELSIGEDDWCQLKAGVSFQECVSCINDTVMFEVQTLKQMMDEKFTSDVSEEVEGEDDDEKCEITAAFLSLLEGIGSVKKYLLKFDVHDNMMAALSSTENRVCHSQQKVIK
jgi:hypothetical protein